MKRGSIIFIVRSDYDDLATGYLAAVLRSEGYRTIRADISEGEKNILALVGKENPLIIGFSVIYQYHIGKFISLARSLRDNRVKSHLTAGGHYATVRPGELLSLVPQLDSVVRSEGEYTLTELANCLNNGTDWHRIENLAFNNDGVTVLNSTKPLLNDLDILPWPVRDPLKEYIPGKKFATLIAGRGCIHSCSFCNLREFYKPFDGPARRNRRPELVADEIDWLSNEKHCSVFLFQDDDFPVRYKGGPAWIDRFCSELDGRGLSGKILWKINCRPDEIDEQAFRKMRDSGLFLVFIGIEDGTDEGLRKMNKRQSVAQCLDAVEVLKKLGIGFDYGFMLFQPSTTFSSLYTNLRFIHGICSDGWSPVSYLKMMPYYSTVIEKELIEEDRLTGNPGHYDYSFREESLNDYYDFISSAFSDWINSGSGLVNVAKWARNYFAVFSRYQLLPTVLPYLEREFRVSVQLANDFLVRIHIELARLFESRGCPDSSVLDKYRKRIREGHCRYRRRIKASAETLLTLSGV